MKVLLVDDDIEVRESLVQTLELADIDALAAGSFLEAKDIITADFEGVVISDMRMPGRDGFHLLDYARGVDGDLPVILLTGEGDIPMAVRAMSAGAFGFLEKPCSSKELLAVVRRAMHNRSLVMENRQLKSRIEAGDPAARMIFGVSEKSDSLRKRVRAASLAGTDVLISGAPGTGISKVAEVVHLGSLRAKGPFEKRASTGLDRDSLLAVWRNCHGGTLFLDEIGALGLDSQIALVDLLDGGEATLIAGTTENLDTAVSDGRFSVELFYRLDVARLRIPSLSERPEDIPVLFRQYVAQTAEQSGSEPPDIPEELLADLMARDWPGNARALMSEAMRFVLGLGQEQMTQSEHLGLSERMAMMERSLLSEALMNARGQARLAIEALKLPRKTFYDKLAKHGLKPEDFR